MNKCICGKELPKENRYCSKACFLLAQDDDFIEDVDVVVKKWVC